MGWCCEERGAWWVVRERWAGAKKRGAARGDRAPLFSFHSPRDQAAAVMVALPLAALARGGGDGAAGEGGRHWGASCVEGGAREY